MCRFILAYVSALTDKHGSGVFPLICPMQHLRTQYFAGPHIMCLFHNSSTLIAFANRISFLFPGLLFLINAARWKELLTDIHPGGIAAAVHAPQDPGSNNCHQVQERRLQC